MNVNLAAQAPAQTIVRAAELVLLATIHYQSIAPIVEAYQTEILMRGRWRIARKWVDRGVLDQSIVSPEIAYLLEEADHAEFLRQCELAREVSGLSVLKQGNCPKLEAESMRMDAENSLIDLAARHFDLEGNRVWPMDLRARFLDLALGWVARHEKRTGEHIIKSFLSRGEQSRVAASLASGC